ncbi:DUF4013 domain-containing protein [Natrinema halophilum]|uniref:DUF4013 domain-containing protein n=1 Tax=Natrinema halophilum TaxID=1699371 RepID=A0A7D5H156_9EURY|nr:DUF4013 domain-containing protein [Natrinema halophilum]QLG48011.1 DUF4013 domain-containing protein [Natrinema halophilum]
MQYCHDCEMEVERGPMFCPECGSELAANREEGEVTSDWSSGDPGDDGDTFDQTCDSESTDRCENPISEESGQGSTDPSNSRTRTDDVVSFPFSFPLGKNGKPLALNSAFIFFFWLVVPLLTSSGYTYRVGRAAARGDDDPPPFDDWGEMTMDGLLILVGSLVMALPFLVVIILIAVALGAVGVSSPLWLPILGTGMLALVGISYVAHATIPVMIGTGSLRKTFSDRRVLTFAFSLHYLKGALLLFVFGSVLYIAFGIIASILFLTVIGMPLLIVLVPLMCAYAMEMQFTLWGRIYNEAADAGAVPPVDQDDPLGFEY